MVAGVLALASVVPLWFGSWIALLNLGTAAERPDPTIPDGDPCCGHPDTWGEVAEGAAFGVATLAACAALLYVAVALWNTRRAGRCRGIARARD
jgi:hypothetical protein